MKLGLHYCSHSCPRDETAPHNVNHVHVRHGEPSKHTLQELRCGRSHGQPTKRKRGELVLEVRGVVDYDVVVRGGICFGSDVHDRDVALGGFR